MTQTRIDIENNYDCTVSIQISETRIIDHAGEHPGLTEILLLIEDGNGDHIATFTPEQAAALERAIATAKMQVMASSSKNKQRNTQYALID